LQRVTNCILTKNDQVLMLKKPSRGWWVAPGGKMELRESIVESVTREFKEETGISINHPQLRGIFTIVIEDQGKVINEWMMFTFQATNGSGTMLPQSPEGELAWKPVEEISQLPMAVGDYQIFEHVLHKNGLIYGTFTYNGNLDLLSYRLEAEGEPIKQFKV
jgi:8-oxo-dGTP diphosphatase